MFDGYQYITNRIIEGLEKGIIPWRKPWKLKGPKYPTNFSTTEPYHGINVMMLGLEAALGGFKTNYWIGFDQASKIGGKVKKGSKHSKVLLAKPVFNEENELKYFYWNYLRVFNIDQVEGIEVKDEEPNPFTPIQEAEHLLSSMNNLPEIVYGFDRACYIPSRDIINMPDKTAFTNESEFYSTLYHELVHSTGNTKRLHREGLSYASEELVAELGASMLCTEAGIIQDTIDNSQAYINGWVKKFKEKPKMIVQCSSKAQKAIEYLLEQKIAKSA